jgi:hypothetical protein
MPWVGKPSRGQNLYCKEQQKVTDLYRNNYDEINWHRGEEKKEALSEEEEE